MPEGVIYMSNKAVRDLQGFLRRIALSDNSVSPVIPDGIFGEQTENSVKSFQRAYNLPVTGIADYPTWQKITEVHNFIIKNESEPDGITAFYNYILPINEGDSNHYVYLLQAILNVLSSVNNGFLSVDITGTHDEKSVNAVKKIQEISGTEPNGRVDKQTWNNISGIYNTLHMQK